MKLKAAADAAFDRLNTIKGIRPIRTSAAMYMIVYYEPEAFKDIVDDLDFCKKLL